MLRVRYHLGLQDSTFFVSFLFKNEIQFYVATFSTCLIMDFNFNIFKSKVNLKEEDDVIKPRLGLTDQAWQVEFNSSSNGNFCWWTLNNSEVDTIPAYSNVQSDIAGIVFMLLSIPGSILNLLLIVALLKNTKIRQEYLTRTVASIAITDLLWNMIWCPVLSLRYFTR